MITQDIIRELCGTPGDTVKIRYLDADNMEHNVAIQLKERSIQKATLLRDLPEIYASMYKRIIRNEIGYILLMRVIFLSSLFIYRNNQSVSNSLRDTFFWNSIVLLILIALENAFGQEVIFLGYFQKHLINTYRIIAGIVICAFLFVLKG